MSGRVLLNIDLGELPEEPEAIYAFAHVANVACGGHAGDELSMRRAVELCGSHGVSLGAHPSYPDREGFGRRHVAMAPQALRASVAEQCALLRQIARAATTPVAFVKPHGALYHDARRDPGLAAALVDGAIAALGSAVTMIGPVTGALSVAAARTGLRYAREAFADRAALADGTLVARGLPDALLLDPAAAAEQAHRLAEREDVDTICVHGDSPGATAIARAVRAALDRLAAG